MTSSIEWTDDTWNPVVGCTRISHGCDHCYAIPMSARQSGMENRPQYEGVVKDGDWTGRINLAPDHILKKPLKKKKPTVYFVNSMSDLFHEAVDDETIRNVFEIMNECPQHVFQVLTKRPSRMAKKTTELDLKWTDNIWAGTSVESDKYAIPRVRELNKVPAKIKFVSAEPLLGPLPSLPIDQIDWLIAGGESGTKKTVRPCNPDWLRDLRDRCRAAGKPFFFKQWGAFNQDGERTCKKRSGSLLDGAEIFEMPASAYDQLPRPKARWVRHHGGPLANATPSARFAASAGRYMVGRQLFNDKNEAAMAIIMGQGDFALNPNRREKLEPAREANFLDLYADEVA